MIHSEKNTNKLPKGKKIILFDGLCNLCNNAVDFIIRHDKKDSFRFTSLQSELAQKLAKERNIDLSEVDSILLIIPGEAYFYKSTAALEIAKTLPGYRWLSVGLHLPEGFRDAVYSFIAKRRYRWFGKKTSCRMPTPELMDKFLS